MIKMTAQRAIAALVLLASGCGKTANVLTPDPDGGAGADAGSFGGNGPGGATGNAGGSGGNDPGGATGSAGTRGGASGSGAAAAPSDGGIDPNAVDRHTAVRNLCSLLDEYPCLSYSGGRAPGTSAPRAACDTELEIKVYETPGQCWTEWQNLLACVTDAPHQCPCSEWDCFIDPWNTAFSPCQEARASLDDCQTKDAPITEATVTGTRGTFRFSTSDDGTRCYASSTADSTVMDFWADCAGPPYGPYQCFVYLNGRRIVDDATAKTARYYASDCESAAKQLSNGEGISMLDCCFTWTDLSKGEPAIDRCSCMADTKVVGFDSCEAAAASVSGQLVKICTEYVAENDTRFPPD